MQENVGPNWWKNTGYWSDYVPTQSKHREVSCSQRLNIWTLRRQPTVTNLCHKLQYYSEQPDKRNSSDQCRIDCFSTKAAFYEHWKVVGHPTTALKVWGRYRSQ